MKWSGNDVGSRKCDESEMSGRIFITQMSSEVAWRRGSEKIITWSEANGTGKGGGRRFETENCVNEFPITGEKDFFFLWGSVLCEMRSC